MKMKPTPPRIVTDHRPKPIPTARFDWVAWYDGREDDGCGYGTTEREAITDLLARVEQ